MNEPSFTLEYRVRPITRYLVTRCMKSDDGRGGVEEKGRFDNPQIAYEVAYALCAHEHEALGYAPGDARVQYPEAPSSGS